MAPDKARLDFAGLDWDDSTPNLRSNTFEKDGKRFRLVEFSRGFEEQEWCVKGHAGYVCEGELDIDFSESGGGGGGRTVRFHKGDGIFISGGGEGHKACPVSEKVLLFLLENA